MKAIQILHLEDSPRDAELILGKLEAGGLTCEITHVDNRQSFEAALASGQFQLVLCDYNLPDYDGISALKLVRESHPVTPVMLISGSIGEEDAVKCLQHGATDYLLKQRLDRLPSAVKRALTEADELHKRQEAEEQIREQAALLDKTQDAIYVRNLEQRIIYWNKGAERLYGWQAEEVVGKRADELFSTDSSARHEEARRLILEKGEWMGELQQTTKGGKEIIVESRRTLLHDDVRGNPKSVLVINTDITDRKRVEQQMLRTQRLESLGTLAGGVAHDLNNALAPILMSVELMRMEYPDAAKLIDMVETSAKRGADMVRQLLTFAKGVEGARLLIQPHHLLKEMEKIIRGTFPKNISLKANYAKGLRTILGDNTQLHQVLLNLCVNARDSMPNGGTLTLEAENVEIDAAYASSVPEAVPGSYVVWRVIDTGTGIPPELVERIFEPFFSTKGPDKGTGLGLSTVMGIIKSHGGFVRVYSVVGQGTTFSVYLPADGGSTDTAVAEKLPDAFRGNGEYILVADDEPAVRQAARAVLTALNFNVITAADGTEALIQVAEKRAELRMVLTDAHMPHMDGLGFVRVLKRMLPDVGIVIASGRLDEREMKEFISLGVSAILEKPFTQEKLVEALKVVFQK
ncbi:MAG: response regulator [Verrucomicrobiota bacterium]